MEGKNKKCAFEEHKENEANFYCINVKLICVINVQIIIQNYVNIIK